MFAAIRSLFRSKEARKTFSVIPNQRFDWLGGVRLYATEASEFVFPGELIERKEIIGTVIDASPQNIQIGFTETPDRTSFSDIRVHLEPGQSVRLAKSTEAFLIASDNRPRIFETVLERE